MQNVHNLDRAQCPVCTRDNFYKIGYLYSHIKEHHSNIYENDRGNNRMETFIQELSQVQPTSHEIDIDLYPMQNSESEQVPNNIRRNYYLKIYFAIY